MKKITLAIGASIAMIFSASCSSNGKKIENIPVEQPVFDRTNAVKDEGKKDFNSRSLSVIEAVNDMKTGWNLGNTLEATASRTLASEMSWQQPKTQKEMFDQLAKDGIKTIRIPVSWANHIIDDNYTIDPKWMARVKEVVDWAIEDGMYVILNIHHDEWKNKSPIKKCNGYYPTKANYEESSRFLVNVWSQISLAFNNGYDEHLIFETMNEPRLKGTDHEWWFDSNCAECAEAASILNDYNQIALDTIRNSGGNNSKRFVSVPGLRAAPESVLDSRFKMPKDIAPDQLIISVHMYTPFKFAGDANGVKEFTSQIGSEIAIIFKKLNEKFIKNGYPVIIGEYGATNKNNLDDRVAWFKFFIKFSRKYGMPSCLWDNGVWQVTGNDYAEHFGYFNRVEKTWFFPEILDAIMSEANPTLQ